MIYEIQKKFVHDEHVTWFMIARTDVREFARQIVESLNMCSNDFHRYVTIEK